MLQFVLIVPLIKEVIKCYTEKGLIFLFIINFIYELISKIMNLNVVYYRILAFRYIFIIGIGVYIFYKNKVVKKKIPNYVLLVGVGIGIGFLSLFYMDYNYKIFSYPVWWRTSMLVGCYVGSVCYFIIDNLGQFTINGIIGEWISKVGRATYHILYVQMLFYVVYYDMGKSCFTRSFYGKIAFGIMMICILFIGVIWSDLDCKLRKII